MAISTAIRDLLAGEQVAGSRLGRKMVDALMAEGLLQVFTHRSRQTYRACDIAALRRYLVDTNEDYRVLETSDVNTRASMAVDTGNSKLVSVRSCPGFPINSYAPIECSLYDKPLVVAPQEGTFLFVSDWQQFSIPTDVTVIGIENMENFRFVRQQRAFFEDYLFRHHLPITVLFVSRYPQSTDLRRWLLTIPNHYLHFGDFDLAGIHIFLTEFQKYIGSERSSFLIPDNIAYKLKSGSRQRYDDQYQRYKDIESTDIALQSLIDLIHHYRKGFDQEGYIVR